MTFETLRLTRRLVISNIAAAAPGIAIAATHEQVRSATEAISRAVTDFGAKGDGSTDDTVAIQAAIDSEADVYFPGSLDGRTYLFSTLKVRPGARIHGDGPRSSILRQISGTAKSAIAVHPGSPGKVKDITEGALAFAHIGIEVASPTGLAIGPGAAAAMLLTDNLRFVHQHTNPLAKKPYSTPAGSCGMDLNGKDSVILMAHHRNLEIRGFDTAIRARDVVNEWHVHGWLINCRVGFDLQNVSTWHFHTTFETGVPRALMFALGGSVANLIVDGGRCEITADGGYMVAFETGTSASNIRIRNPNIFIAGDGSRWPGRKFTGSLPQDVVFDISYMNGPLLAGSASTTVRHALPLRLGGWDLGDGQLVLGRNLGDADATLTNQSDGRLRITGANGIQIAAGKPAQPQIEVNASGLGFHGSAPASRPVVAGKRGNNSALASLLTALATYGLIEDRTTP